MDSPKQVEPVQHGGLVDNLAMLVRRLSWGGRKYAVELGKKTTTMDQADAFLKRHGLQGSVLHSMDMGDE